MAKANILIADDDEMLRKYLEDELSESGYKVITASDGKEAVKALEEKIDLAFLDIKMPEPDGIEVGRTIRKKYPNTKIFYITGYDIKEAYEIGDKVIMKPYLVPDILKEVEGMFAKKKLRILIADDEEVIRVILGETLEEAGYEIIKAESGNETLKKLSENYIDLAMLDIKMPPGPSGIEVGKIIKEKHSNTKIIYITGSLEDKAEEVKDIGDIIIGKPFNLDVVKEEIKKILGLD